MGFRSDTRPYVRRRKCSHLTLWTTSPRTYPTSLSKWSTTPPPSQKPTANPRVITEFNLPIQILSDQYSKVPSPSYEFEGMLRVFLYKHIGGFTDSEFARRLAQWPYLRLRLGLQRAPNKHAPIPGTTASPPNSKTSSGALPTPSKSEPRTIRWTPPEQPTATHATGSGSRDTSRQELRSDQIRRTTPLARTLCFSAFETGRTSNATYSDQLLHNFQAKMSLAPNWGQPTTATASNTTEGS